MVVTFEWTPGKKSTILKEIDKAAKSAAKRGGTDVDRGYMPGTVARSMVKGAATRFQAQEQIAAIRVYRKNVMAKGENKVRFDLLADDMQSYVASCYAYASPETAFKIHRHHGYRVRFNGNPSYPQILEVIEEVTLPSVAR